MREYGSHPSSNALRGINRFFLAALADFMHNDAMIRLLTKKNNIKIRLLGLQPIMVKALVFTLFFIGYFEEGLTGAEWAYQRRIILVLHRSHPQNDAACQRPRSQNLRTLH